MCGETTTTVSVREPDALATLEGTTLPERALIQCSLVDERVVHALPAVRVTMREHRMGQGRRPRAARARSARGSGKEFARAGPASRRRRPGALQTGHVRNRGHRESGVTDRVADDFGETGPANLEALDREMARIRLQAR
jgi:hypothetical protein